MLQKIKSKLLIISSVLFLAAPAAVPVAVHAQLPSIDDNLCSGANLDVSGGTTTCDEDQGDFQDTLTAFINIISIIIGAIAVIMIIFGGFRYMTSGGDATKVSTAKNTILYALIGLILVAVAQIIVRFVLNQTSDTFS